MITSGGYLGVKFWDARNGKLLLEIGTKQMQHLAGDVHLSGDGRRLLVGWGPDSDVGRFEVWDVERSRFENTDSRIDVKLIKSYDSKIEQHALFNAFVLAPDDSHVVCLNWDGTYNTGSLYTCEPENEAPASLLASNINTCGFQPVTLTPDKHQLLAMDVSNNLVTLDLATRKTVSSFSLGSRPPLAESPCTPILSLSPDGNRLSVAWSTGREVVILDPKTGQKLYSLPAKDGPVTWLTWSPNSQRLAVSRTTGEIAIWDIAKVEKDLSTLGLDP
jgi:WD40 repeat protein